jgi:hypothetical protein
LYLYEWDLLLEIYCCFCGIFCSVKILICSFKTRRPLNLYFKFIVCLFFGWGNNLKCLVYFVFIVLFFWYFVSYSRVNRVINDFSSYWFVGLLPRCWIVYYLGGKFLLWVGMFFHLIVTWSEFKSAWARMVFI